MEPPEVGALGAVPSYARKPVLSPVCPLRLRRSGEFARSGGGKRKGKEISLLATLKV